MKMCKFGSRNDSTWHKYLRILTKTVVLLSIMIFFVIGNPYQTWAWNCLGLKDIAKPEDGLGYTYTDPHKPIYKPCEEVDPGVYYQKDCLVGFEKYWVGCNGPEDWRCLKTHEWIVHKAIEYLKDHGYIVAGSWFDSDNFKELLQWGVAYADHTGRDISAGVNILFVADWDIDGCRHFYHPADIWVAAFEGDEGVTGFANVGDLTAPQYANQLYKRAVEFWPHGTHPIDLSTLTEPWYLGWTQEDFDSDYYSGWGEGTDPRSIWEVPGGYPWFDFDKNESCADIVSGYDYDETKVPEDPDYYIPHMVEKCVSANKPKWPPWVKDSYDKPWDDESSGRPKECEETAAIYLGWALHMIQDMSVYHHTKNLHGIPHQEYESDVQDMIREDMVDNDGAVFSKQLPIPAGGEAFCVSYVSCEEGGGLCCELKKFQHCYDIFPDLAFYNLDSFDAESLANKVAFYTWDQKIKSVPHLIAPTDCPNFLPEEGPPVLQFNFKNKAYIKHCLDAAIKASAALIFKFINSVSQEELPEDRFEPNDSSSQPWRLGSGSYYELSINDKLDEDYYLIEMPYRGDLEIRIDYDKTSAGIAVKLDGPNNPYWPEESTNGEIFKLKGIDPGEYLLHLQSSSIWNAPANAGLTTTSYDLHVTIGGKRLDPDYFEDNDTPETPYDILRSSAKVVTPPKFLTIDEAGDDDYYVVKSDIGYRIDASITFNPSEGDLRMFLNNKEVKEIYSLGFIPNYYSEPSIINKKVLQELQNTPSLSPNPSAVDQTIKTLSISHCSSGRDIIRITGQPNYYSISVSKKAAFDECGVKLPSNSEIISPDPLKIPSDLNSGRLSDPLSDQLKQKLLR